MHWWTDNDALRQEWTSRDPFEWLLEQSTRVEPHRSTGQRTTFRFETGGSAYFAKLHHGIGWRELAKNLTSLRWPIFGAQNEVRAAQRLREAGVRTLEVVAHGSSGRVPVHRRSFVVTRDVGTQLDLRALLRAQPTSWDATKLRRRLIANVAVQTRRMHDAGVNHRDLYLMHFLVPDDPEGPDPLVLIDLHRAGMRAHVPARWRTKDLGGLAFDAADLGLTRTDHARFRRAYLGNAPIEVRWPGVLRRAERMRRERSRKGDRFGL